MRGASNVEAFDIDTWSMENGEENATRNHCKNIRIRQGTIRDFEWPEQFDIILANINKNILLAEVANKNAGTNSKLFFIVVSLMVCYDIYSENDSIPFKKAASLLLEL